MKIFTAIAMVMFFAGCTGPVTVMALRSNISNNMAQQTGTITSQPAGDNVINAEKTTDLEVPLVK